jgi:penicillin amidase
LKIFNGLDHARNYSDYNEAVTQLHTPGQNAAFACKNGDIAIRTQGDWPAKWKGQGDFVMPGTDTAYLWQGMIPQDEVPFLYNPERGFISSANQKPLDESYPYYLGIDYPMYRGLYINKRLTAMNDISPQDMMALQTDNYDIFGAMATPLLLKNLDESRLDTDEKKYAQLLKNWNFRADPGSKGTTVFEILWKNFMDTVFDDEYARAPKVIMRPIESSVIESLLKDSAYKFLDNINTPQQETLTDDVTAAFKQTCKVLKKVEEEGKLEWSTFKGTHLTHLARVLAPFNRMNLPVGGGTHCINAAKPDHGPSWRMVISLTKETEAYGVYPGGQNGNPGSSHYDDFVDQWVSGKYFPLWMMKRSEEKDKRVKGKLSFSKG